MSRFAATFALLLLPAVLIGCGGGSAPDAAVRTGENGDTHLPGPETASGDSVTGMPDEPGPNPAPVPAQPSAALPGAGSPLDRTLPGGTLADATPALPVTGIAPGTAPLPQSVKPTTADAVAVVRDYYAAIAAGHFEQAYGLWADNGGASGQSPQQFAAGFADVASLSVDVLAPGRVEPAAGSRYIEVPVALTTVRHDGSRHRYVGAYTLRRSVVDGASGEQRAWRLQSADIREVRL